MKENNITRTARLMGKEPSALDLQLYDTLDQLTKGLTKEQALIKLLEVGENGYSPLDRIRLARTAVFNRMSHYLKDMDLGPKKAYQLTMQDFGGKFTESTVKSYYYAHMRDIRSHKKFNQ